MPLRFVWHRFATSATVSGSAASASKMSNLVATMIVRASIMPNQLSKIPGGKTPQNKARRSIKLSGITPSFIDALSRRFIDVVSRLPRVLARIIRSLFGV